MKSLLIATVALLAAGAAQAGVRVGALAVSHAWSRPAVAGTNGVGYLTIANTGRTPDALVEVQSPLARRVEMHSSSMSGPVMSMKTETRVVAPAGGAVAFAPGGYHLMLIGLARTVKAGDEIPATLRFASGARLQVAFTVGAGDGPPAMEHMHSMNH